MFCFADVAIFKRMVISCQYLKERYFAIKLGFENSFLKTRICGYSELTRVPLGKYSMDQRKGSLYSSFPIPTWPAPFMLPAWLLWAFDLLPLEFEQGLSFPREGSSVLLAECMECVLCKHSLDNEWMN